MGGHFLRVGHSHDTASIYQLLNNIWVSNVVKVATNCMPINEFNTSNRGNKHLENKYHPKHAIKMIWEQISLTNQFAHHSATSTIKQWQWRTQAEHSRLKSGPPFMRDRTFIRTSVFLRVNWCLASEKVSLASLNIGQTPTQLTREWSRVQRRWVSCLRPTACLHWSLNQGLSLLRTQMTLVETKRPNNSNKCSFKPQQDCEQILYCTTNCIRIDSMFN